MRFTETTPSLSSTRRVKSITTSQNRADTYSDRHNVLNASWNLLPLSPENKEILSGMNFSSIREVFRAALAGKLAMRKNGSKALEEEVLANTCIILGHPYQNFTDDQSLSDQSDVTVEDAMASMNGRPFLFSASFLKTSVRDILFPSTIYEAILKLGIETTGDLLKLPIGKLRNTKGIGQRNLRTFMVCTFDYFFILHDPVEGISPVNYQAPASRECAPGIRATLQLESWFTSASLEAGTKILRENRLLLRLMHKNLAGALFSEEEKILRAIILYSESKDTPQHFTIISAFCSCRHTSNGNANYCQHLAALAIETLGLTLQKKLRPLPLPLLFQDSPWLQVARILADLCGVTMKGVVSVSKKGNYYNLIPSKKSGRAYFSCLLPQQKIEEAAVLFREKLAFQEDVVIDSLETGGPARNLLEELITLDNSWNSQDNNGITNNAVEREKQTFFWFWLAQTLFATFHYTALSIYRDEGSGLFHFQAGGDKKGEAIFNLTLPRARTPDLLDSLARLGLCRIIKPARANTRIYFDTDGSSLLLSPSLKLADGRIIKRQALEPMRYGRYYFLNGEGFLPVKEQKKEHAPASNFTADTVIEPNDVPSFLRRNQKALWAEENDVDPALSRFGVINLPRSLEVLSCKLDNNWCYLSGHYGIGSKNISLQKLLTARQQGLKYFPGKGEWLKLSGGSLDWLFNLGEDRVWEDSKRGKEGIRLTRQELLKLTYTISSLKINIRAQKERTALQRLLDVESWQDYADLPVKPEHLRTYQLNGLSWLYQLYTHRLGGVLADDMGLGKTHQALGFFQAVIAGHRGQKRFLVVCPASVVSHWSEKAQRFYPDLDFYVHHGSNRNLNTALKHTLIITTYGIARRDSDLLEKILFDAVVLDEIQQAKNKKTDIYQAVQELRGEVIIGLTGTPLENSVLDLKAIFDLCLPDFLGSDQQFKHNFAGPIEERNDRLKEESLSKLIHPFLLRRTREQVLTELPDVIEDFRTCELSDDQVRLYRDIISGKGRMIVDRLARENQDSGTTYMELLAIINYLKQICDHPCLIEGCQDSSRYQSGKWDLFLELLHECLDSSIKVVVFSHYTKMLDIIENYLTDNGIDFCGLRGDLSLQKRKKMIDRFNHDPGCRVFTASLLAGGVGVDLTAAQAVIHYDRWWNAAREDQATARVHRMGQKHVVQVFKLISAGTLEEKIHQLIEKKREMAHNIIREDDASIIKQLSKKELIELLMWGNKSHHEQPA